jgi:hypothetical protein
MRLLVMLVAALFVGAAGTAAHAQDREKSGGARLMGSNSEGFHFMVGFMQNEINDSWCMSQRANLLISLASRFDAPVKVRFQDGSVLDTVVAAFTVVEVEVPWYYEMIGEDVFQYGIEISAERPISVTCYNSKDQTSDGYLALPTSSWGTQYISACYYVDQYDPRDGDWMNCWAVPRSGEFAVIAAEDSTVVNVYPSTKTVQGIPAGQIYRKVLQKGQIFQVQDGGDTKRSPWYPGTDITGSVITASKPVGLISGHVRTGVPNQWDSKDHLCEMLPPRNALGKRYMIVPFGGRTGGDVVRVISTVAFPTNVTITSAAKGSFSARVPTTGEFFDYDLIDPVLITADAPILVTQYSRSQDAGRLPDSTLSSYFDPDMVVITPEEQFVNGAVFQTLSNDTVHDWSTGRILTKFVKHYVSLVGERATFDRTMLDGKPIALHSVLQRGDFPTAPYSWAVIEVPDNMTHVIESEGLFGGYVYGVGNVDSYAWPIGSGLRQFDVVDDRPPVLAERTVCGSSEIIALDSGRTQLGLVNVWLDTTVSRNATFTKTMLIRGDELSLGHVRPIDARQTAFARVWAEDLAGLRTSIDVTITSTAPSFSADSISMGNVAVGQTVSRAFTITNTGSSAMLVDSIYLLRGRDYLLDRPSYRGIAIGPDGGQLTLTVYFRTDYKMTRYDTLVVVVDCREYRIPLVAYLASPRIATHELDFGRVRIGRERTMKLLVINTGDATLQIDSAVIDGATFAKIDELPWPVTIEPGVDTVAMSVVFRPTATAPFEGTVRFYSNVPDSVAVAPLHGVGIYPALRIGGWDFGRVQIGDTVCQTIAIENIGSDTAFLTGLMLPTPDGFIPDRSVFPAALPQGGTLMVRVCFAPTAEATYRSDVSPRNDDDLEATNELRGIGFRPRATLGGADMGRLWIGDSHDSIVYVTNVGTDPITVTRVWLDGGDVGDFYVEPLLQERTLAPNERMPVSVRFTPLLPGDRGTFIHAATTSRFQPQLDSVLVGFGLFALSTDTLEFADSLAYACGDRGGRIVIENEGNTPLTIASITSQASPPIMTLNAPSPGYVIAVGESLELDFTLEFAGYSGTTWGSVSWSFEEPPNAPMRREFSREFSVSSAPQRYVIASTTPARVNAGEAFPLAVRIDSALWRDALETEIALVVEYSPSMIMFDSTSWATAALEVGPWRRGAAKLLGPGKVELHYVTSGDAPLPISGVSLPTAPFRAFIGERDHDTLRVTMTAVGNTCAPPALAASSVALDSICGLSVRLFEYTGSPFVLRQNRPNPVAGRTQIDFTLSTEADARLELFGPDGRLVRVLVDAMLPAGDYSIPLDVRQLASGLYFYRLTSGTFTAMRQMQVSQ